MSANLQICTIKDDLRETIKNFRFAKSSSMDFIIVKINKDTLEMVVDEKYEDSSIEELQEELPQQQPRFILISYALNHGDGRTSYPLCLVFYSPSGCSPEQKMLYAGSRNYLVNECQLSKNFEVRDVDELTQEYLDSKAT